MREDEGALKIVSFKGIVSYSSTCRILERVRGRTYRYPGGYRTGESFLRGQSCAYDLEVINVRSKGSFWIGVSIVLHHNGILWSLNPSSIMTDESVIPNSGGWR